MRGCAPGVAPPNDAVRVAECVAECVAAECANSYNRFNIIRIPEIYKDS